MLASYVPSDTLLLSILGSAKQQCLTPSSSVDGRRLASIVYAFHNLICVHGDARRPGGVAHYPRARYRSIA